MYFSKMITRVVIGVAFAIGLLAYFVSGRISTRCYVCRSRGELGDCMDPFSFNDTTIKELPGSPVSVTTCPSGWCVKLIEGIRGPPDEFGSAIERKCRSFAPTDGEERCAEVKVKGKASLHCTCRGDLCNSANPSAHLPFTFLLTVQSISWILNRIL